MDEKTTLRPHRITIDNRSSVSLTGISDVVSFDENQMILDTDMGLLTIKGSELHVGRLMLESGEVSLEGKIDHMEYSSNDAYRKSGQSLLTRLFR